MQPFISTRVEIDELADELADAYVEYLNIDTRKEQSKYEESTEEGLAHLEEVCSALEIYKQSSVDVASFVDTLSIKNRHLTKLYEQIDALEQYIFEANQLLDRLDTAMRELESYKNSTSGNRIARQIFGLIPHLSTMPRLSLFNNFGGTFMVDTQASFSDREETEVGNSQQLLPVGDILDRILQIETSVSVITSSLDVRLHGKPQLEASADANEAVLGVGSAEQVDGSWQELL